MGQQREKLYLRAVKADDMMLLYRWVNDPAVRKSAFQSEMISLKEHQAWFHHALQNPNVRMFILMDGDEAVGQVRLTVEHEEQTIDYSVDAEKRGRGYGMKLLSLVERDCTPTLPLLGKVKIDNGVSCRLFEKLGYTCEKEKGYNMYHKFVSINDGHKFAGGTTTLLLDIRDGVFIVRTVAIKNSIAENPLLYAA